MTQIIVFSGQTEDFEAYYPNPLPAGTYYLQISCISGQLGNGYYAVEVEFDCDASACDDGQFCNGVETCDNAGCAPGVPPNCSDGIPCTTDTCNETTDTCVHTPVNAQCNDGVYCNGLETCSAASGCVAGTPVNCADGVPCTVDSCNEATDSCDHVADDSACADGHFCNGMEVCDSALGCLPGTPPCPSALCDETKDICVGDMDQDGVLDNEDVCNSTPFPLPTSAVLLPNGTLRGDLDGDCDCDLMDFAILVGDFTGPG